jgi:uncharacterized protein
LLFVAHEALGEGVLAVTATSPVHPLRERHLTEQFTKAHHIRHRIVASPEMGLAPFLANETDRCYICKQALFRQLLAIAEEKGLRCVAHGANMDDLNDYRPGFKAAEEMGILAPLIEAGFGKEEIRMVSKAKGIGVWNKPAGACLATRIPYGDPITVEKLKMIEAAETFLLDHGLKACRVRHHGAVARIEMDEEGLRKIGAQDFRKAVVSRLKEIGFLYVALDLEGYHSGSMNRGHWHIP